MRTIKEERAIAKYAKDNSAVPQLSTRPYYRFKLPDGSIVERHIQGLLTEYNNAKEEEKRSKKKKLS